MSSVDDPDSNSLFDMTPKTNPIPNQRDSFGVNQEGSDYQSSDKLKREESEESKTTSEIFSKRASEVITSKTASKSMFKPIKKSFLDFRRLDEDF